MAKVTAVTSNYCVPIHRIAQVLTQSHNSDHELHQPMFHTENVRLLSEHASFALCTSASLVLRVVTGKLTYWEWEWCARTAPAVRTQCKLLDGGHYLNPSFGVFSLVGCSITVFFCASCALRMWHI